MRPIDRRPIDGNEKRLIDPDAATVISDNPRKAGDATLADYPTRALRTVINIYSGQSSTTTRMECGGTRPEFRGERVMKLRVEQRCGY